MIDFYVAELKNVKTAVSASESSGDDAISYVQLHRELGICTVKCKYPKHEFRSKAYKVTMIVNENDNEIISYLCNDCAASAGGCKHAVAFLMWVHRCTEKPACTSITTLKRMKIGDIILVSYDSNYVNDLIKKISIFWKSI